jgi:hypothetical protein
VTTQEQLDRVKRQINELTSRVNVIRPMRPRLDSQKFEHSKTYRLHIDMRIGKIPNDILMGKLRTDGRMLGNFAEMILINEFWNLSASENGNTKYDLIERPDVGGMRIWEVKTGVRKGVNFLPSGMKGVGRKADPGLHLQRCENLFGFIVFDVTQSPLILVRGFRMRDIEKTGQLQHMNRKMLNAQLNQLS